MPTMQSVMADLKSRGSEKTRITYGRHGLPTARMFGVSITDLKVIAKTIKGQQDLACELYATGNLDAMYLAGIVADGKKMTRKQLQSWADGAEGMSMIYEYPVPWVTVESSEARELAMKWIASKKEHVASAGWCTYTGLVTVKRDAELDLSEIEGLLKVVVSEISGAKNRVKLAMNGFVIAVATYVEPLLAQATSAAKLIGVVSIDVGDTACKVRVAAESIAKVETAGKIGLKRKTIRC